MHALLDTTQVLRTLSVNGVAHEVCVEAVAWHDRSTNLLKIDLKAFLRCEAQDHIGEVASAPWLPSPQSVTEHVESGEAHEMAVDVFSSWKKKVAAAIPGEAT